jgi:hypothetical protein
VLAAFIFTATQTEYPHQPLTAFVERPWIFLSSFLCQPAFCLELVRFPICDWIVMSAVSVNCVLWASLVYRHLRAHEGSWSSLMFQYFVFGIVINFGNYMAALIRSA